jgi:hypothetical protein
MSIGITAGSEGVKDSGNRGGRLSRHDEPRTTERSESAATSSMCRRFNPQQPNLKARHYPQ